MNETQLKEWLTHADAAFGTESVTDAAALAKNARQRAATRKRRRVEFLAGGALVVLLAVCLVVYNQFNWYQEKKHMALEIEIKNELADLKAQTDYTLGLIQSVNQRIRKRQQIVALQRRLASLAALANETEMEDERLAGELYQKAQSLSSRADSCNAVKALYQQIVQTFPDSSYTTSAKEKLAQLGCLNGLKL